MYVNVCIFSSVHEGQMLTLGTFLSHLPWLSAFETVAHSAPGTHSSAISACHGFQWSACLCLTSSGEWNLPPCPISLLMLENPAWVLCMESTLRTESISPFADIGNFEGNENMYLKELLTYLRCQSCYKLFLSGSSLTYLLCKVKSIIISFVC